MQKSHVRVNGVTSASKNDHLSGVKVDFGRETVEKIDTDTLKQTEMELLKHSEPKPPIPPNQLLRQPRPDLL